IQSRMATGVQLQRLDDDDAIAAVALVPHLDESDNEMPSESVAEAIAETVAEAQVIADLDESPEDPDLSNPLATAPEDADSAENLDDEEADA
ncbi:MAG: hypothetical protein AAFQ74_22005, partial [Cyanobacteria bacterium J06623_4]